MQRPDGLYERGLIIKHNMNPVAAGFGSAIFMHIWRSSSQPTAGCTAMSKTQLEKVLSWLKPGLNPILVQLPLSEWEG